MKSLIAGRGLHQLQRQRLGIASVVDNVAVVSAIDQTSSLMFLSILMLRAVTMSFVAVILLAGKWQSSPNFKQLDDDGQLSS
ncbi:uncharacterized protein PHALS_06415 [Plasmopara halstedii]|uniref:Uncharacterized protein n=1 Tax=Plasmopara halstedii TaxID=4781 RepID=A0A0P1B3Y2_PLAHL|nr:uncharacterized protein PHALS_06415 [Plasmopara halstedii]CEG48602.1 hypothetical protein PHALS_06415 [Plasmopara halstedii]|eukprot:XP_024584971.1 hypothetical protein PHALS_06415 [Plasmopara halstedii]